MTLENPNIQYSDAQTFLQTSLGICERLFEKSPLNSAPFTIMSIEGLAKRHSEELENIGKARIITGPFTIIVSKSLHDYQIRLAIPNNIPEGLVFNRLRELRNSVYREFEKQGIPYFQ